MKAVTPRVFVDSDVIISSLISSAGAAYILLNNTNKAEFYISNISIQELFSVINRLNLKQADMQKLIRTKLHKIEIGTPVPKLKKTFNDYVLDENDAHIVAGAKEAKTTFLISYNIRHFKIEKIQQDLKVTVLTPGLFLQYLRSL